MNQQCEPIQELLTSYALGDLSAAKASEVKAHLDTCGDCQAALRQVGPTLDVLRDALAAPSSAPARLSDERRRRVFATAPGAAPAAVHAVKKQGRGIVRWITQSHPGLRRAAATLLVGASVLALLMTGVVVNFSGKQEKSSISASRASEAALRTAVDMYEVDTGHLPASLKDLANSDGSPNWHGPYVRGNVPVDPWGKPYQYTVNGDRYDVKSPSLEGELNGGKGDGRPLGFSAKAPSKHGGLLSWFKMGEVVSDKAPEGERRERRGQEDLPTSKPYSSDAAASAPSASADAPALEPSLPDSPSVVPSPVEADFFREVTTSEKRRGGYDGDAGVNGKKAKSTGERMSLSAGLVEMPPPAAMPAMPPPAKVPAAVQPVHAAKGWTTEALVSASPEKEAKKEDRTVTKFKSLGYNKVIGGGKRSTSAEETSLKGRSEPANDRWETGAADALPAPASEPARQSVQLAAIAKPVSPDMMRKAGKPEIVPPLQSGLASVGTVRSPSGPQTTPGGVPTDTDNREVAFYDYLEGVSKESGSGKVAGKPVENSLTLTHSIAGAPKADPASYGNGKSSSELVAVSPGGFDYAGDDGDNDDDGLNDNYEYFADQSPDDSKKNRSAKSIALPVVADRSEIQRQIARLPAGGSESSRKDVVLAKQEETRDLRKALDSLKRIRENDGREEASARSDGTIGRLEKPLKDSEKLVANAPAADSPSAPDEADSATIVTNAVCFSYDPGRDAVSEAPAAEEPKPEVMTGPRFKAEGVNPMVTTVNQPFSTFSIDVDTASYTLSRNYMLKGQLPPAEAVRTEEFVNFFDYDYAPPINKTFGVYIECAPSKFGHGQQLLKIGVKGRRLGREEQRGAVLTILVDTSGSMNTPDRIELAKKSLRMLVEKLAPNDTVTLVQYDNHARVVLEPTQASNRKAILVAIDGLQCNGSTNLEEGMQKAYEMAGANFVPGAENRVLLLSDGVANLGTSSAADILSEVEAFRKQGVFCSVFGMGQGTYNDEMLEALANKGDGVYRFIDSEQEARQVFVDDLAATLNTIARDVKIQVEFNPANVKSYRQLGYENRQLKKEDFRNDAVDAGEVGSGQSVTALYELDLAPRAAAGPDTVCTVRVRYMRTDVKKIEEIEESFRLSQVGRNFDGMDARFKLAACAAEAAEILRGSPFAAGSECDDVASVLRPVALELSLDTRVAELLRLASGAKDMARGE